MKAQFDNQVVSSFMLWFDHTLLKEGEAYTNTTGLFYDVEDEINGYFTYALPYKQIVSDKSITGAKIPCAEGPTGLYVNGNHILTGTSGWAAINYFEGQVYFTGNGHGAWPVTGDISGRFAVKDFNIYLTNAPEEKLLLETKHNLRPKVTEDRTGVAVDAITYPAIFLRYNGAHNEPFAFGGHDSTMIDIRAIVLGDNQFHTDAVCSIFRDKARTFMCLFGENEMPYNTLGGFKNSNQFDYTGVVKGKISAGSGVYIDNVWVSRFDRNIPSDMKNMNSEIYPAFIDFEISKVRLPRQQNGPM